MPLVAPHSLFRRALAEGFALGAFNTSNLEVTQAIVQALADARSPGIVQTSEAAIRYAGLQVLVDMVRDLAAAVNVPIVLHLDHGTSLEVVEQCLGAGYASVMIDGSALPFSENVALTKQVVARAHATGVWVEGEIGALQGKEGLVAGEVEVDERQLTDPHEAERFVAETGVDALAVSVGTLHGAFRGKERIRVARLRAIHGLVHVPLVLHGGSGLPADDLRGAIEFGIAKVNVDTELREAFHDTLLEHREDTAEHSIDPRKLLLPARDAVQAVITAKVSLLGSAGKAK